jgi:UDP-glucose 6-dehydrogenase
VIGVGWVGLVTGACFAEIGHPVVAMDVNAEKIESLRSGQPLPIHEPGLPELVEKNRERLTFTTDMSELLEAAQLLFCCVDTPPTYSGDADLSRVEAVVASLPDGGEHALVMKSTVPAGTGETIRRSKPDLVYVSCPEFLKEGSAVKDFLEPDRVVIGADPGSEWAADAIAAAYEPLGGEIVRTDVASAEMIKLASNAFLATKISFINEIANVCEGVGADVSEVARGMGLDNRIGPQFLQAGIGYGGSCFAGTETLLVRDRGWLRFDELWMAAGGSDGADAIVPADLTVWSWVPGEPEPEWMPVAALTRREFDGDMVEIAIEGGDRVVVTDDHPFIVAGERDRELLTLRTADSLTNEHWLPTVGAGQRGQQGGESTPGYSSGTAGYFGRGRSTASTPAATIAAPPPENADVGWRRVAELRRFRGTAPVFSLEVPGSQTVVVNGCLIAHNCFPKDVSALKMLAGNTGYHFQLLNSVIEVNELQKRRVIAKLSKHLGTLVGKRVALLGLAFKPNTDDMREASSLVLSARLQGEGASVVAYDPVAEAPAAQMLPSVELLDSAEAALADADAAILVTEWPEFSELPWEELAGSMSNPLIVDGRNFLDGERLRAAGFTYEGIGRA